MANQMLVRDRMDKYYALPNPNLRSYLHRQVVGQPDVYETPFARGESLEDLLRAWDKTLVRINKIWPSLYAYEEEMRGKVGPMSVMKPLAERMEDILAYYNLVAQPGEPVNPKAIQLAVDSWSRVRGLRLRSAEATVSQMKLSTNSGNPYFTKRRLVMDKLLPYILGPWVDADIIMELPEWQGLTAATLGWRGQEGGPNVEDVKQRVLWMFPFAVNVDELRCYQPLIQSFQRYHYVPAWEGNDAVDQAITKLFDTADNELIVCTDFTKFDQHFNVNMQQAAQQCLSELLTPTDRWWLSEVFPIKYNIPLCIGWGQFSKGPHGMASGSGGTNADETLGHKTCQFEAALDAGKELNPWSMCLGDDGLLTFKGITAKYVTDSYSRHGLEMNISKQYESREDCIYLRRWHHRDYRRDGVCVGVYSTMRALGRLREQERFINPKKWGPKAIAMRQLSILENCRYHPLGVEFIEFCIKRDKYRLGLDIPGFFDRLDEEFREAEANDTLYVSYSATFNNPKPPSQWWVVNVLRKLA